MRIVGLTAAVLGLVNADHEFECSCAVNWPRSGMWHIGSAMMDNGMNFTDFENPEDSPVGLMVMADDLVLEPASRMLRSFSRDIGIDMDMMIKTITWDAMDINGMPMKDTVEAFVDQLSKIVGNQAVAEFYQNLMVNFETDLEKFEEILNQAGNNSYAIQQAQWVMEYVSQVPIQPNRTLNWPTVISEFQINRDCVTSFIQFFRQFMIDWFENTDYQAQMEDGLMWLRPIFESNDWENIDNLLSAPEFVKAVQDFQGMIWVIDNGMTWEQGIAFWEQQQNNTNMNPVDPMGNPINGDEPFVDQLPTVRKRRQANMMDIQEIISTVQSFLPEELQHIVMAVQQSPIMDVVGHVMTINETEVEQAIGNLVGKAVVAFMQVNNFNEPLQQYMVANEALSQSVAMQELVRFFMMIPEKVEGQLIPFKLQHLMNRVWNFLNADEIVAISEAQDNFALYWFQQVSAEQHVDVIYAASDVIKAFTGMSIDDIPIFVMEVEAWIGVLMDGGGLAGGMTDARSRQRRDHDEEPVMIPQGCACNPMDRAFTIEGKIEMFEESQSPMTPGSPDSPDSPDTPEEPCWIPVTQNLEVFNQDGTVRPYNNPKMCAATKNLRNKQAVRWMDCDEAKQMGYETQFTYEMHSYKNATLNFDEFGLYPVDEFGLSWFGVGTIRAVNNQDRCWTIANSKRATSKSSVVFLKNCDPQDKYAGRQQWTVLGGNILLTDDQKPVMNSNWRSFVGIPYLGQNQKLKTRRVHDVALGGSQQMADGIQWINANENGSGAPDMGTTTSPIMPPVDMPECVFIGTEELVMMAQAMFMSPGHEQYNGCVAMTHEQAENLAAGMP